MSLKTLKLQVYDKFRGKDTDTRNERASRRNSTEEAAPSYPKCPQSSNSKYES